MRDVRVIRSIGARPWIGVIRVSQKNSFADWILSRWTMPQLGRRVSPSKDFRREGHSGTWLSLATHLIQERWQIGLALNSPSRTNVRHHFHLRQMFPRAISAAQVATKFIQKISFPQIPLAAYSLFYPTVLETRAGAIHQYFLPTHVHSTSPAVVPIALRNSPVRAGLLSSHGETLAKTFFHYLAGGRLKINRFWQGSSLQIRTDHRRFASGLSTQTTANRSLTTSKLYTRVIQSLALHTEQLRIALRNSTHQWLTQPPTLLSERAKRNPEDNAPHALRILRVRETISRERSRPMMQFAQAVAGNQPEVLSAIRNVEKTLSKVQPTLARTREAVPDMQRLTTEIYGQLERHLRIERERRGR